jgi:hypothetical protein
MHIIGPSVFEHVPDVSIIYCHADPTGEICQTIRLNVFLTRLGGETRWNFELERNFDRNRAHSFLFRKCNYHQRLCSVHDCGCQRNDPIGWYTVSDEATDVHRRISVRETGHQDEVRVRHGQIQWIPMKGQHLERSGAD